MTQAKTCRPRVTAARLRVLERLHQAEGRWLTAGEIHQKTWQRSVGATYAALMDLVALGWVTQQRGTEEGVRAGVAGRKPGSWYHLTDVGVTALVETMMEAEGDT
jgi:hypothetical protein